MSRQDTPTQSGTPLVPSPSQREAIEAPPHAQLVLAGPGAGKTFCLTERIRFLIEHHHVDPARICAFTFTNKAAGEIAHRLASQLGPVADAVKRGTIHAFCAELMREFPVQAGLEPGFGIADEEYQLGVLRRLEGPKRWHRSVLTRFALHRFRNEPLLRNDKQLFERYEHYLTDRNLVDFDSLVTRTVDLFDDIEVATTVRSRWDVVLVDEYQDLNPIQYRLIRELARDHHHVFAVGDDEQSIYAWAGAHRSVFTDFVRDFDIDHPIDLLDNRRCPADVYALARRLLHVVAPVFPSRRPPLAARPSAYPVRVLGFATAEDEAAWIVDNIRRDRDEHGHAWGDVALLYRKHEIGHALEVACIIAGVPCRLAAGRALADDPVAGYVIAAAHVIARPDDAHYRAALYRLTLPGPLYDEAVAKAEEGDRELEVELRRMAAELPRADERAKQIRRALADCRNLGAAQRQHTSLSSLVQELLSRRVGRVRSALDERHDEISDPATLPDVVALSARLSDARQNRADVWLPPLGGAEVPLCALLAAIGIRAVRGGEPPAGAVHLHADDAPSVGLPLGLFKAAQLIEMQAASASFSNFTAVDLETTDRDTRTAEIVELAAVRVRDGVVVDQFQSLVKPDQPVTFEAARVHGISNEALANAPTFAEVWPTFRAFCGGDVVVAHNGYDFDFKILKRMALALGAFDLCTFDSLPLARELVPTSRTLANLATEFGIPTGTSHRALDDTIALAHVLLRLDAMKLARARKTALQDQLGHLGLALALCDELSLGAEARLCAELSKVFALGRYSGALERYEEASREDASLPPVQRVIERLGGAELMARVRAGKTADERYPAAMLRLRHLIADIPDGPLLGQLVVFLERAALSKQDGSEPERERVNLLTMHSTKGLEFSHVYIVGVEDAQLPGGSPSKAAKPEELDEARRLLYVGMTRTVDQLVMTYATERNGKSTGGHQFLDDMGLVPQAPT